MALLQVPDKSRAVGEEILRELQSSSFFNELVFKVCNASQSENAEASFG